MLYLGLFGMLTNVICYTTNLGVVSISLPAQFQVKYSSQVQAAAQVTCTRLISPNLPHWPNVS